jgi:hypothetical protein
VAPFFVAMLFFRFPIYQLGGIDFGAFALVKTLAYAVDWAAFPIVMVLLARLLSLAAHYVPYIIAYNWSALIQVAIFLPVVVIDAGALLPQGMVDFLQLIAYVAVLAYLWFITRVALRVPGLTAAGLVTVAAVLTILIEVAGNSLLGVQFAEPGAQGTATS